MEAFPGQSRVIGLLQLEIVAKMFWNEFGSIQLHLIGVATIPNVAASWRILSSYLLLGSLLACWLSATIMQENVPPRLATVTSFCGK